MDEKVRVLRTCPLFADLDDGSLQAVAELAREVAASAGDVLMREGQPGDTFLVIVDGTVRIEREGWPIRSMTQGGFLGEIALFDASPRTATATCVTDVRLLEIQRGEFDRLLDALPAVYRRVRAVVGRRLRDQDWASG